MGLSLPQDYCFHCHEDVAEQRPSHVGMTHDSCSTAGCHNYHDNKALYENFLYENVDQPDNLDNPAVALRNLIDRWTEKHVGKPPSSATTDGADTESSVTDTGATDTGVTDTGATDKGATDTDAISQRLGHITPPRIDCQRQRRAQ